MNEEEALDAVKLIKPRMVIPTHYNCPMLFMKNGNPANELRFKLKVEHMGVECAVLGKGAYVEV
jgi:L-ascorbate metabolism protein UlaG (beta-lactamase superfamily)